MYLPCLEPQNSEELLTKGFLEYDKLTNQIFDNQYLADCKFVVKVSIPQNSNLNDAVKINRFVLSNNVFLTSY